MCDTFVALRNATTSGGVLFAKNSDRDPNEAHELMIVEGKTYPVGNNVRCTYIEIPQVKKTNTVLLAKPFWIWGAEMGANEHGVVIGNEAVFTKYTNNKEPGLIGMDFLRLALERTTTAFAALELITNLLEKYGQSGNCGFAHPFYYDNSYLIADRGEAWVLETAGKQWAAEKVKDIRSISNILSIEEQWDLASKDIIEEAVKNGWCKKRKEFNFRKSYSDFLFTTFGAGGSRQNCSSDFLDQKKGELGTMDMFNLLRTHKSEKGPRWTPGKAISGADICMHAGFGPIRVSQTTGSMVANLRDVGDLFWLTGTAAPCVSIFKPVWLESGLTLAEPSPEGKYNPDCLWWRGEELHRKVLENYSEWSGALTVDRDQMEADLLNNAESIVTASSKKKIELTDSAFKKADQKTSEWQRRIQDRGSKKVVPFYYASFRRSIDRQADFPK